jgi:predicted nucleic acid-binding protein
MLIDTDVIIWFMRGNQHAADTLDQLDELSIPAVTYMELVQSIRNRRELSALRKALAQWQCPIHPIDTMICTRAMLYVEQRFHRGSLRTADALIGATAISRGLTLLTGNVRHYKMIPELTIKQFKP